MSSLMKGSLSVLMVTCCMVATSAVAAPRIATVNGSPVPQSHYDFIVDKLQENGQEVDDRIRQRVADKLVQLQILYQAAKEKRLNRDRKVAIAIELAKMEALAAIYVDNYVSEAVSEEMLMQEYEEIVTQLEGQEYKLRHILVKDKAQAKKLLKELGAGADFSKLAEEHSIDPGSQQNGGDLGWGSLQGFVPEFSEAVKTLKKGEFSKKPVQTQFGYHLIVLDDTREMQVPSFEEVQDKLTQLVKQRLTQEHLQELRSKANVKLEDLN